MSPAMGMGIGTNTDRADRGHLRGTQLPVACSVWFTSTGRIIPKLIKYQDKDEHLHTLEAFRILYQEDRYYCGISIIEYCCEYTSEDGILFPFHLLFYIEQKEWKLWWKNDSP